MHRLTNFLFVVADILAWLLLAFAVVGALTYPFVGPVHARMSGQPITALGIVGTSVLWLAVALGAYAITRRQVFGIALVLLPAVQLIASGQVALGLVAVGVLVLAFATPFILAISQARSVASGPAA